jgi:glucose-1-phosphate cytidylyltransferase
MPEPADIPVFVLCGGLGTRLGDATAQRPKPMLEIGDRPMLTHVMGCYDRHGFRRFVLCAGHKAEAISAYFLNFAAIHSDFTVDLRARTVSYHQTGYTPDWDVTVAHTGARAMTGCRLARATARYLGDAEHFAVTYGDGLTDADLGAELAFHLGHDRIGTVLGVNTPSQFGRLELHEEGRAGFAEKPVSAADWISGGFFLFRRRFLDYLVADEGSVLERGPLPRLAADSELMVFPWQGYWSCVDTVPDHQRAVQLWETGAAPWRC